MAAPPSHTPQVEEVFTHSTLQAEAERPDTLDRLGPKWSEFLAGKGQGLKAYMDDLQLAYRMLRDPNFPHAPGLSGKRMSHRRGERLTPRLPVSTVWLDEMPSPAQ